MPCWLPTTLTAALAYSRFLIFVVVVVVFGCLGSSLLRAGFSLVAASGGYTPRCGARASHCGGFSCCRARALGTQASVVAVRGLSSCGSRHLECRPSSWPSPILVLRYRLVTKMTDIDLQCL